MNKNNFSHSEQVLSIFIQCLTYYTIFHHNDIFRIAKISRKEELNPVILFYAALIYLHYTNKVEKIYKKITYDKKTTICRVIKEVVYQFIVYEILFYCWHRFILHHPATYLRIHSVHHRFIEPSSLATFYAHVVENLVTYILFLFPAYIKPVNSFSFHIYAILWLLYTMESHNNKTVFLLAEHHIDHHQFFNCNFGMFGITDWLFGTTKVI